MVTAADIILLDILYSNIHTILQCLEKPSQQCPAVDLMLSSEPQKNATITPWAGGGSFRDLLLLTVALPLSPLVCAFAYWFCVGLSNMRMSNQSQPVPSWHQFNDGLAYPRSNPSHSKRFLSTSIQNIYTGHSVSNRPGSSSKKISRLYTIEAEAFHTGNILHKKLSTPPLPLRLRRRFSTKLPLITFLHLNLRYG